MRAKGLVFHLMCFTCTACSRPLNPGDYFGMRDEHVYCRLHYEMICVGPMDHQNPPPMSGMFTGLTPTVFPNSGMAPNNSSPPARAPYYNGLGHPHSHPTSPHPFNHHKGRPRKRKGDIMSDFCAGRFQLYLFSLYKSMYIILVELRMRNPNFQGLEGGADLGRDRVGSSGAWVINY